MNDHIHQPGQANNPEDDIPSGVMVRKAREGDGELLFPILNHWIRDSETGDPILSEASEIMESIEREAAGKAGDRNYFVAEDAEGNVVGVIGSVEVPDERMLAFAATDRPTEFINAFVSPEARGSGVGKSLLRKAEQSARDGGFLEVIVNSGPRYENTGWAFWTAAYGEPIGVAEDYYAPGVHAPVWAKKLV